MEEVGRILIDDYVSFLDKVFINLKQVEIDVSNFELDHICYRVSSIARYNYIKEELAKDNELLGESLINQRPIASFLLSEVLRYKGRNIEVLELPSPKPYSKYTEGYEHVEFVINEDLTDFKSRYSHISFDGSGFDKVVNRDLRIRFKDVSVKFHEQSLRKVMEKEQENQ